MEALLSKYPKRRVALPDAYRKVCDQYYQENREGSNAAGFISSRLEKWMHKKVASVTTFHKSDDILEIGAGTLNHVQYESNYKTYDIVEPFEKFYERSPYLTKINRIYNDVAEIGGENKYSKIISVAVLEHVLNLPELIARSALLLSADGVFCFGIPSEGTIGWKLGYTLSSGIYFRIKYGLKYSNFMNYEHVNTAKEIEMLIRYFFNTVEKRVFGFSNQISFYQYFFCQSPDITRCMSYLSEHLRDDVSPGCIEG